MIGGTHREGGFATTEIVLAAGLALGFFTLLANLIVMQYALGVMRAAVDEGARQGAAFGVDPVTACEGRIGAVLGDLLEGPLVAQASPTCSADATSVRAELDGVLRGWLPLVPDLTVQIRSVASRESP